ncbi:LytR family transcriptional regulator [Pontibacillus halophilus JSM 076056 = DSM 19796]|uniref:Regulatory protein MsrR n=1 Tax=Pontibacillus halophilus JSM 076056 = DSM 19796 TaxID=1385510 RepID=A0A0A5I112_9BACI|nr:LCP family protein [Pontibacillus halophilus]KGX89522.1 LytR family transcriptional regulator [Pontibacillus halophilus JSM 076056 = DSM 19796]
MNETRAQRRGAKRKRKRRLIMTISSLLMIGALTYVIFEFSAGLLSARGETSGDDQYEDAFHGVETPTGKSNILVLGIDQRSDEPTRSDTIMVAQYDGDTNEAKLVSIMRDSYVNVPDYGWMKINAAHAVEGGGPELMRKTIEQNFGIPIHYYAVVDFEAFTVAVDTVAPDGVNINVEKDMYYKDGVGTIDLDQGEQQLDGEELLGYARFRNDRYGDYKRVERQQLVMQAVLDEFTSFTGLTKLPRMLGTVTPYIETNMDTKSILGYGRHVLLNGTPSIETFTLPSDLTFKEERVPGAGAVLTFDEQEAKQAMEEFFE